MHQLLGSGVLLLHWHHHCGTAWLLDLLVNAHALHGSPGVDHAAGYCAHFWQPHAAQCRMDRPLGPILCGGSHDLGISIPLFTYHSDPHLGLCLSGLLWTLRDGYLAILGLSCFDTKLTKHGSSFSLRPCDSWIWRGQTGIARLICPMKPESLGGHPRGRHRHQTVDIW